MVKERASGFKVIFILPLSLQGEILKLGQVSHLMQTKASRPVAETQRFRLAVP